MINKTNAQRSCLQNLQHVQATKVLLEWTNTCGMAVQEGVISAKTVSERVMKEHGRSLIGSYEVKEVSVKMLPNAEVQLYGILERKQIQTKNRYGVCRRCTEGYQGKCSVDSSCYTQQQ